MKTKLLGTVFLAIAAAYSLTGCSSTPANIAASNNSTSNANTANAEPVGTPVAGGGEDQAASAEALVADLYKQHDAKKSPFFQTKNRALVDKYFTRPTADLIWKDATSSKGEVGALEGDPLYAAQDMEIKNLAIGKGEVKGDNATVAVNFTNYGQKVMITFLLKMVNGAWKIDDIKWPENTSLVNVIKENYKGSNVMADEAYDGFDGKYQVGDTSCTVKPVKMAFEIRWAKGSGVETFFSKNETTFESQATKEGGTNRFEFDDTEHNTGTFYRADGKTFPVKRAK